MRHRFLASFGVVVAIAGVWFAARPIAAQSQTTRDVEAIKAAERKLIKEVADDLKKRDAVLHPPLTVPKNWKPARTPWGDPDLTGVYSNSDEAGIPFEKPSQFEGRRGRTRRSNAPSAPRTTLRGTLSCSGGRPSMRPTAAHGWSSTRRTDGSRRKPPRRGSGRRRAPKRGGSSPTARLTALRTAACTTAASRAACRDR